MIAEERGQDYPMRMRFFCDLIQIKSRGRPSRQDPLPPIAASARVGLLEASMGCDRGLEQLFLLRPIARRPTPLLLAALRRGRAAEAPEIAKVAQRALQVLCGLVNVAEFAGVAYPDIRQRFQHVAEPFRLDPQ